MAFLTSPSSEDHHELAIYGVEEIPTPRTLVDIFHTTVALYPDAPALVGMNETLNYRELAQRIDEEISRLAELGIGLGDRIGIRVPSGTTDLYIAILATICSGAAYVPVDWDDIDERAKTVWEEAQVCAVYGKDLQLDIIDDRRTDPVAIQLPTTEDDAWIIFTSGSTGKPKGVAITHRSAAALVDAEARMYLVDAPLGPGDKVMAGLSVAFDASCEEMWLAWRYGAALIAAPRDIVRSADVLGKWITDNEITAVSTVPTLASFWPTESLSAVRLLIFGGEALPSELSNRLYAPGRELWNTYGPTESTVIASGQLMKPLEKDEPVRIGRATPGWQLVVVDPSTNEPVRWGESGELIVGGVGLGRYLDPVKDAEVYAPLPSMNWQRAYRTGDLVIAEKEGLIFAGRADDQIKFGGRRMELGEIDRALSTIPGVSVAAAAKQKTNAGSDVIVGYIVADGTGPQGSVDLTAARAHLSTVLPGGIAPTLCIIDELPKKTSGKVDRKALPWPLPTSEDSAAALAALPDDLKILAGQWMDQLGPVPISPDANFFDLGGSSVAIAKLAVELRSTHPALDIGALYDNPTLAEMAAYLSTLSEDNEQNPQPQKIPWWSGIVQFLVVCGIYVINAARYIVGAILVVWVLRVIFHAGWVPRISVIPWLIGWFVLFSTPGKIAQTVIATRILTMRIKPGEYLRGGWTHLRIWAAERIFIYMRLDPLLGTPFMPILFRLFGCKVGKNAELTAFPPVSGLATIGDDAEVLPGSCVDKNIPAGRLYSGSPIVDRGEAGQEWPLETPEEAVEMGAVTMLSWFNHRLLYGLGLMWMTLLPMIAVIPAIMVVLPNVIMRQRYEEVFPVLTLWTPIFAVITIVTWLVLVVLTVRACAVLIKPGYFPEHSTTGWALWLTHSLLQKTLTSTYFMYAGLITPAFLRLLGARVGKDTEISTVETIPHLTWVGNRCFLADHSMCAASRHRRGWVHIGTTVLGDGCFVGNSGIVGPDLDLPSDALIAVLSSVPGKTGRGTSWMGRTPRSIPRQHVEADAGHTFNPPEHLKVARLIVELFRLIPVITAAYLDLFIVWVGTNVYMHYGMGRHGLIGVIMWAFPIVLVSGIIASVIPIILKWLIVGRFTAGQRTLFSTFVWRGELVDNTAELLAVPSLVRMSLGSPLYNWWARLMGTRIGRSVWCETWWLPEFDLISIEDNATVNRGTVLQTHLFHDRVMSLETVTLGQGSTLGPNSFMLPGSSLGQRSIIRPGSLVLRQDSIPQDTIWSGNPVSHVEKVKPTDVEQHDMQLVHPKS
ncbi:Non-ribosomal peptide synthetase [Corynebacterium kutscheri]|uniref:non-ribosomal peptide synthetase n=1 Tax=Corynebacterium kutscheri TaxID=35755 RepID=UPI000F6EA5E3|nr:non-ribosomal peptide synthetase [Corynebacterium kutscheri]VEH81454.1 Non-ribosomal peptide synthetase [Corynebacterium kutscheri]